jgi:NADH-quinone oxidoreductase subunit F
MALTLTKVWALTPSSGTEVFALAGKVKCTGLVKVPMGTALRELVFDIGGGILDKREFKAVQTGVPSGGCIPRIVTRSAPEF